MSSFFDDRGIACITQGDRHKVCFLDDYDHLRGMQRIHRVMKRLCSNDRPCYSLRELPNGARMFEANALGKDIIHILMSDYQGMRSAFSLHRFNPAVDLFMTVASTTCIAEYVSGAYHVNDPAYAGSLNNFVASLRTGMQTEAFKVYRSKHIRAMNKNFQSLQKYISALFNCYARLLVVRVDLGYEKEYGALAAPDVRTDYPTAKLHRERLIRHLQRVVHRDDLAGHVWKLEYGPGKGFHYHTLFFFDGSKAREDVTLGKGVGDYWRDEVTLGKGVYFNCNARKQSYESCGLGMVNHYDVAKRQVLVESVASYLVKPDDLAQLMVPEGGRVFGKGLMPEKSGVGRPRTR